MKKEMDNKKSIADVAKKAGVAASTVSRVINGGSVSNKTREIVMKTIQEMEYHPNFMARGLRGIKNKVIGILSIQGDMFGSKYLMARLAGINSVLQKNGYDILLVQEEITDSSITTPKYTKYLNENRIDGLIILAIDDLEQVKDNIQKFRNIVYTGEKINQDKGFRVYLGNYDYSYEIYDYLISKGHTKILSVYSIQTPEYIMNVRKRAYKDACEKWHTPYNGKSVISYIQGSILSIESISKIYQEFLSNKYTVIFANEMQLAKCIIEYFADKGLKLGEDYSIIGIERAANCEEDIQNPITAVYLSDYEYGEKVAELMMEILNNPNLVTKDINIYHKFKIKNSIKDLTI